MILGDARLYPADAVERALPDADAARALLARRSELLARTEAVVRDLAGRWPRAPEPTPRHTAAFALAIARLALRHGSLGADPHPYHNEEHALELAERRLAHLLDCAAPARLTLADALHLALFAACHDLRQRERGDGVGPVGANEAASMAETRRILDACGYDRNHDRGDYLALELMIAGSTFDTRPPSTTYSAEAVLAGGALAHTLADWLDRTRPGWRDDAHVVRGVRLARLAADLDTANVGESLPQLAASALRLCREHEWRAGRELDDARSASSCLAFLTDDQERYFFGLHRFASPEGERAWGAGKRANAEHVRAVSAMLRARFADAAPSGRAVLEAYTKLCGV